MEFLEGRTVGIDLGTTYSAIAYLNDEGEPEIIANADDRTITPSVVLLADDGKVLVGPSFERISIEDPEHIVEAVKREMGNKDFYVVYQGKKLTPEFISAMILKKTNRPNHERRHHRPLLLQRRPKESHARRWKNCRPECDRHHQRTDCGNPCVCLEEGGIRSRR